MTLPLNVLIADKRILWEDYWKRGTGGHYNLGVMYLKGIGMKKDVKQACKYFIVAAG